MIIIFKAINDAVKDNEKGIKNSIKLTSFSFEMLGVMKNTESVMVGIDIKRDIFIELYLSYPKTLRPVIVIPDLDVPGIRDMA